MEQELDKEVQELDTDLVWPFKTWQEAIRALNVKIQKLQHTNIELTNENAELKQEIKDLECEIKTLHVEYDVEEVIIPE